MAVISRYRFGLFSLDVRKRRLYKNGEPIQLAPKTYEILLILVEQAGNLVEKDHIIETIWPDQFIEESNLAQHIYKLRKLLDDKQGDQEFIITVPGKGYIFCIEVQTFSDPGDGLLAGAQSGTGLVSGGEDVLDKTEPKPQGLRQFAGLFFGSKSKWNVRHRLLLVSLAIAPLLCLVIVLGINQSRTAPSASTVLPVVTRLVTLPGEESDLSFSPDGRYLAFSSEGETKDNQDIYVKMIDQDVLWRVTSNPEQDKQAVWSPDGTRLAFLRSSGQFAKPYKLIIVPVRGGVEQEIGEVWGGLSWSPDGKYLAVSHSDEIGNPTRLALLPVDGGERRFLTLPPANVFDTNQQFSPDGRWIAFVRWRNNSNADLFAVSVSSGELKQLTFDESVIPDYQWDTDSQSLYFISNRKGNTRLWSTNISARQPEPSASSLLHLNSIAISPNGEQLAFTQPTTDTQIETYHLDTAASSKRVSCMVNSSQADDSPRFSPDGSRIAFVSTRTGLDEIWIANADCTNQVQLTRFNQHGVGSPRWSPDGERIVFDRNIKDNTDIFTIRADGTDVRQLTSDGAVENMPSWSRDGKWIYFGSNQSSVSRIHRVPTTGGAVEQVTNSPGRESIESADGRVLYYTNSDRLWRKDLLTGQEAIIPELADTHIGRYWEIAEQTLYFVSVQPGKSPAVRTFDLRSGRLGDLFELQGSLARWVPGISYSPSAKQLAIGYVTIRHGDVSLINFWR